MPENNNDPSTVEKDHTQAAENALKWEPVKTGLRAHLWIACPNCGDDSDYIEFDDLDLDGSTEVTADCEDCGQQITAYLDALVQRAVMPAATAGRGGDDA